MSGDFKCVSANYLAVLYYYMTPIVWKTQKHQ